MNKLPPAETQLEMAGKLLVWLYQFFPGLLDRQLTRLTSLYD